MDAPRQDGWKKGDRIRVSPTAWQWANRTGTITKEDQLCIKGYDEACLPTPEITLDDGTVIYGFQVWWELIGEGATRG